MYLHIYYIYIYIYACIHTESLHVHHTCKLSTHEFVKKVCTLHDTYTYTYTHTHTHAYHTNAPVLTYIHIRTCTFMNMIYIRWSNSSAYKLLQTHTYTLIHTHSCIQSIESRNRATACTHRHTCARTFTYIYASNKYIRMLGHT